MSWGNYAVVDEAEYRLKKEESWFWKFKAPTSGDELAMSKFLLHNRSLTDVSGVRREYPPTNTEICYRELALTFAETNIPVEGKEGGEPILKVGASVSDVEKALQSLPHAIVEELWSALADKVPGWGPRRPNE